FDGSLFSLPGFERAGVSLLSGSEGAGWIEGRQSAPRRRRARRSAQEGHRRLGKVGTQAGGREGAGRPQRMVGQGGGSQRGEGQGSRQGSSFGGGKDGPAMDRTRSRADGHRL